MILNVDARKITINILDIYSNTMTHIRKYDKSRVVDLGILHEIPPDCTTLIGWTINIPTKFKVQVTIVNGKRRAKRSVCWEYLTHEQQVSYLTNYIRSVIGSHVSECIAIFEQTKQGNLHVHAICYDPTINNSYHLSALRKSVSQHIIPLKIAGTNLNRHRYLNYIHFLQDVDEWLDL